MRAAAEPILRIRVVPDIHEVIDRPLLAETMISQVHARHACWRKEDEHELEQVERVNKAPKEALPRGRGRSPRFEP